MDFALSQEQEELRSAARRFLADQFPPERVAALADSDIGWDPASWKDLATLGWLDPRLGQVERGVLAEESGYSLYPGPLWTMIALAQPAFGEIALPDGPATLAWRDDGVLGLSGVHAAACRAEHTAGGWRVTGVKREVPDAAVADQAAVVARGPDGTALWRLDLSAHPDVVHNVSVVDSTRRVAELWLDHTPVEPLVPASQAPRVLFGIRRAALALLACEAVGVTHRALDVASARLGDRSGQTRAGLPYPGVSRRIANVHCALHLARAVAYRAVWCVATGDAGVDEACATATAATGHAALFACENALEAVGRSAPTQRRWLHRLHRRAHWINAFEGFPSARRHTVASGRRR